MKINIIKIASITWLSSYITTESYQIKASNFYTPRPKTLRRIAKNLALAKAIETLYTHPLFTVEQQDLLRAIPTFISTYFTKTSTVKTTSGATLTVEQLIVGLKKLEVTLLAIQQQSATTKSGQPDKVVRAIQELLVELEKIQ